MDSDHKYAALLREFYLLLRRNWEVQLQLIFREGNIVADCLAKKALVFHNGDYFVWSTPPQDTKLFLHQDMLGLNGLGRCLAPCNGCCLWVVFLLPYQKYIYICSCYFSFFFQVCSCYF